MINSAKWIWLPPNKYFEPQETATYASLKRKELSCYLAEFKKDFVFDKKIEKIIIEISADVKYFLYLNERYVGVGPVTSGGDFRVAEPMPQQYYNVYEERIDCDHVCLRAFVQTLPIVQTDNSQGKHNGFICACQIFFSDDTSTVVYSDESWACRLHTVALGCNTFDYTKELPKWENAEEVVPVWNLFPSEIPNLVEEKICVQQAEIVVEASSFDVLHCELDKIYSVYYTFQVEADGDFEITIYDYEKDSHKKAKAFFVKGNKSVACRSLVLRSAGAFDVEIKNFGKTRIVVKDSAVQFQHYPCLSKGEFYCSDEKLNQVYDMGRHALKICRQTIELDSPMHQENLSDPGDYLVESLMNYYADGDVKLTRFDIVRIARYLEVSDGYMFHTTYALIWVQMVYDYYTYSGDETILHFVKSALGKLFARYANWTNKKGVIDNPPNYMFVDWILIDEYSMHHPPKALGQTVLNAFYYNALKTAAKIYGIIGEKILQDDCQQKAEILKLGFSIFYDAERGLYFDGSNEDVEENAWLPKNAKKRYYSWHSNTLAVLYDLAPLEKQQEIIRKMVADETLIQPQPYFMHFSIEAIYKAGLFEEIGMKQLDRWKNMTVWKKGLLEVFWEHFEGYSFDYSHAWGGTPTYQLPNKLSGLKILKAGFEKISLQPRLFGLKWAKMKIPTPKGVISLEMKEGEKPVIDVPQGIEYEII